jgi:hypothetical protein
MQRFDEMPTWVVAMQTKQHPSAPKAAAAAPLALPEEAPRITTHLILMFCRALDEVNRLERRPVLSAIEYVMSEQNPSLDLSALGFSDLTPLALAAERQGLVRLTRSDRSKDVLVQRADAKKPSPTPPAASPPALSPQTYRAFLETKLKSPIPPQVVRRQMYDSVADILLSHPRETEPITLLSMSYQVSERMRATLNQQAAFKLLFALVLAGTFRIVQSERPHEIQLLSAMLPSAQWDILFQRSCVNAICRDRPKWHLCPNILAEVFGVPEDTLEWLAQHRRPCAP